MNTLDSAQIEAQVVACLKSACARPDGDFGLGRFLVTDLGLDSIDLVDLIYHLEKTFGITIKMGDFEREARRRTQGDFEVESVLTPAGRESLKLLMPEVPPEKIREGLTLSEIPLLFTVGSLVGMVESKLRSAR